MNLSSNTIRYDSAGTPIMVVDPDPWLVNEISRRGQVRFQINPPVRRCSADMPVDFTFIVGIVAFGPGQTLQAHGEGFVAWLREHFPPGGPGSFQAAERSMAARGTLVSVGLLRA